jgi:DNA/RNA endonuclease G (NUC1)
MKKFVLLLLLPLFAFAPVREKVYFKNNIYQGYYSEKLEQPLEVQYTVMCPNGTAKRTGMDFFINDSIHTSDNNDYANNVYDKGHCAPAADFNCTREMLLSTFSYLKPNRNVQGNPS